MRPAVEQLETRLTPAVHHAHHVHHAPPEPWYATVGVNCGLVRSVSVIGHGTAAFALLPWETLGALTVGQVKAAVMEETGLCLDGPIVLAFDSFWDLNY